ncbi:hypothetical protein [Sphingomonas sp. TDK1]|uniref:hypothetical protein n=1 Tax=Sphingomonas sp. TDK1 TaxID=453247 RepID=UPI0007D97FBF|nr:hypothetical protein [Sphingomonas sp. TDK1]OAN65680.1 hypothetical protein A7X12_15295 [Sphingomonas sp. TDK1]
MTATPLAIRRSDLWTRLFPIAVLFLAGWAVRTPLARAHPLIAGLLFLWIASDSRLLSLIATAPRRRPAPRQIVAGLALAVFAALIATPPAVRSALLSLPMLAGGMAILLAVHLCWGASVAWMRFRTAADARWVAALSELLPPPLVRVAAAELRWLHLGLFRWGAAPDVPAGCQSFAYHRHLTPMAVTLLALQAIEIAVHHLLLAHWSARAAYILFVLSDVGLIYMIALIKSFRLCPVLLTPEGARVRAGLLVDQFVPYAAIVSLETSFDSALVKDKATLNAGLLGWPNLVLRLHDPLPGRRPRTAIAFRLDDPEPFVRALRWRLESRP